MSAPSVMTVDLETENHDWYGQLASPHCPNNYVVAAGWALDHGPVQHEYVKLEQFGNGYQWQLSIPDSVKVIVAHNAMYEMSWFLTRYWATIQAFLKRGGRIWCTAYAEYLLSMQQDMYPALDEVAPRYGGTHKIDAVKTLWEQGYKTSEIDPVLLLEYLAGPEGDVENTRKVFYGQQVKAKECGMTSMIWERMEGLVAYAHCEYFGLHVDREVAGKNQAEQEARITELKAALTKLLPADLPREPESDFEFNYGSDFHVSALLYGGAIKYRKRVPYDPPQFEKADYYKFSTGTMLEVAVFDALSEDEQLELQAFDGGRVTFKAGKNKGEPKVFREDTDVPKLKWADDYYKFPGLINLKELPEVLREKFYYTGEPTSRRNGEFVGARFLSCGTPVYSSAGDVLAALAAHGAGSAGLLAELGTLEKDTGTYYLRTQLAADGAVKKVSGMLQYVQDHDSIVHHSLNLSATVTGRLSSSRPNLQNLPRDGTSKVKQMFTSRFLGGVIGEVDYTALEVVMLAALSKDNQLLRYLIDGVDMHSLRLSTKLREGYESVLNKVKDEKHPEHKLYKQMRTDIKSSSFAGQYGASARGIAFATGVSLEYAEEFLANEAKLFPQAIAFRQVIRDEVERTGNLPGGMRRQQKEDGSYRIVRQGYWTSPAGTRYAFTQQDKWVLGQKTLDYKDTQIANYWCQGEAGFMMIVAMGRICRWLIANDWFGGQVCLINNVHDAAYTDSATPELGTRVNGAVSKIMASMPQYLTAKWPAYDMATVPFPAAAEQGPSMYEKYHLENH